MSDRYVKVKIQVEDMKSLGEEEEEEDAGKKGVDAEEQVPAGPPPASVSPDPAGVTRAGRDASNAAILCRHRVTSRSKLGKDAKHSGSVASVGKHLNRLGHERALHIKGTGTILRGKLETNGNYVNTHPSPNNQETRREDGFKVARKRRPVTVDISKAKTSLEALKLSIKQLRWKEFPLGRRAPCDIYWHGVSFHDNDRVVSGQVNKFPGMIEMLRKINLSRAVRTMQELFPEEYDFYPRSWILPEDKSMNETPGALVSFGGVA
ncbi:Tubulin polyglutamylase TTLL11 [Liparis tanakae]|uniref:Tubulin polyglutamylase TTLL11 n=1 Tax=Liparis tanakae TaxID=230148 RepID=A0A4Z2GQF1_9TELE|nr:Tubulin polyglutamylase TTLL11 [Liparis tanakae]